MDRAWPARSGSRKMGCRPWSLGFKEGEVVAGSQPGQLGPLQTGDASRAPRGCPAQKHRLEGTRASESFIIATGKPQQNTNIFRNMRGEMRSCKYEEEQKHARENFLQLLKMATQLHRVLKRDRGKCPRILLAPDQRFLSG